MMTVTVTDSVGVVDDTSRIHDAKRTPIETVGIAGSVILSKRTSISVNMSLDMAVSPTLSQIGGVPIYATSGASGGGAGRSSGGNRNRRLPKSRLVRR